MPIPTADGGLYFASGIDNSGLIRGKQQAVGIIKGLGRQISGLDVFAGLAAAGVAAFIKITKASWALAKDFDMAMREVQTISDAAKDNFDGMKESVIKLSKGVPDSAEKLSKALYQIVSAGYDGAEGLQLLEVASKAAVGGVTDTMTAADGLTTVMNAWKISAKESEQVADTFFQTVKLGKTTFGELASNIAQVAPLAAAYGVSFEQVAAATATLTKQGTSTSMAMTQIRQALIAVNEELGAGWSETYTLQEAFAELSKRAEESGKDIKEFTGRVEGAMAILGMTGKNAAMAAGDLESISKAAGASGKAFDIMRQAAENNIRILKNRWHARLLAMGDSLINMFGRVANAMNTRQTIKDLTEQAVRARALTSELVDANTEEGRRKEILEELKKISPDIVDGINAESIEIGKLQENIEKYNTTLAHQIALESLNAEERKQAGREAKKLLKESEIEYNLRSKIMESGIDMAKLEGKSLKEQAKIVMKYYDDLAKTQARPLAPGQYGQVIEMATPAEILRDEIINYLQQLDRAGEKLDKAQDKTESIRLRIEGIKKDLLGEGKEGAEGAGEEIVIKTGEWKFSDDEWKKFQQQIKDAQKAYDEWNKYKKTSLADELQDEYSLYTRFGDDYEKYLQHLLKSYEGNAQARMLIMKELAEIEWQYIEATEKIMAEFYKSMADEADTTFKDLYADLKKSHDDFSKTLEKTIEISLINEKEPEEAAKAYVRFGKVVFLTSKQLEELEQSAREYINALGMLGSAISDFGANGNAAMQAIGEGIQAMTSILSGNYIGGVLQLMEAINNFQLARQEMKQELSAEKEQQHIESLNHQVDILNRALEEHIYLLNKLQGEEWFVGAHTSIDLLKDKIKQREKDIQELTLRFHAPQPGLRTEPLENRWSDWIKVNIDLAKMSNKEIQEWLDKYWEILLPGPRDLLQQWLDEVQEAERAMEDVFAEMKYETIGIDTSEIINSIVSAFEEGKLAAQDFADTFEDVMKKAMIQTFKRQFLVDQIQRFYDVLYQSLQTTAPTAATGTGIISTGQLGEITDQEMYELQRLWGEINTTAAEGWKAMEEMFDNMLGAADIDDPNSLAGAIRRELTEETGSLLAGRINTILLDVRQMTLVQGEMADHLNAIRLNTSYNRFLQNLGEIRNDIHALRSELTA